MVFKLIRVDVQKPKINVPVGKHIIGRAKFLHDDDTDKRVSRIHAELEVSNDSVSLKSLHQNPCFYTKKSSSEIKILQQDCDISLNSGDRFGLLPDNFWYELIHILEDEDDQNHSTSDDVSNGIVNKVKEEINEENGVAGTKGVLPSEHREEDSPVDDLPESESLLNTDNQSTQEYNPNIQAPADSTSSPMKRTLSADSSTSADMKKVKIEADHAAGDATAGPSNSDTGADTKDATPTVQTDNKPLPRERCIYGENCYRRNPQHKAQFSHPADGDWGPGARGQCPWGAACRRREPRHWAAHEHPPDTQPPPPRPQLHPGIQMVERRGNIIYISARTVNFYDDHFEVEDSDGDSVDFDYEF